MGCHATKACDAAAPSMIPAKRTLLPQPDKSPKEAKPQAHLEDVAPRDLLKHIFEGIDADGDGKIDMDELSKALQKSAEVQRLFGFATHSNGKGAPPVPAFFTEQVLKMDVDRDGKISFEEFEQHFFPKINGRKDSVAAWATLWKTFNAIDSNHDGELDIEELSYGLRHSEKVQRLFNVQYYWCTRFCAQAKLNYMGK